MGTYFRNEKRKEGMNKQLHSFVRKWGELKPVYIFTRTPGEFCVQNSDGHETSFGKLLLNFVWCSYIPIENDVIIKTNGKTMINNIVIFECKWGILPNFLINLWRIIFRRNDEKVSISKKN